MKIRLLVVCFLFGTSALRADDTKDLFFLRDLKENRQTCKMVFGRADALQMELSDRLDRYARDRKKYSDVKAKKLSEKEKGELEEKLSRAFREGMSGWKDVEIAKAGRPLLGKRDVTARVDTPIPQSFADSMAQALVENLEKPDLKNLIIFYAVTGRRLTRQRGGEGLWIPEGLPHVENFARLIERRGNINALATTMGDLGMEGLQVLDLTSVDKLIAEYYPQQHVKALDIEIKRLESYQAPLNACIKHETELRIEMPKEQKLSNDIEYRTPSEMTDDERKLLEAHAKRYQKYIEEHRKLPPSHE